VKKDEVKKEILERIKVIHSIQGNEQDSYIKQLTSNAIDEFLIIADVEGVEEKYLFIIEAVVNKRYIRRGDEGIESVKSTSVWITYSEDKGDFEEYKHLFEKKVVNKRRPIRTVRFL